MEAEGAPLTERQQEAALAMAPMLWAGKDKDEVLATYFDLARSPEARKRRAEWQPMSPELDEVREALLPGALAIEEKFPQISRQWPRVFWRGFSELSHERIVETRHSGLAQIKYGETPTVFDNAAGERFVYTTEHRSIALGVKIAAPLIENGEYARIFASSGIGLAESLAHTEEILHANHLNTGCVYDPAVGGDGQPLFSEQHPIDRRYEPYSNLCRLDLGVDGVLEVIERIKRLPDQAGLMLRARATKLVVPIALEATAARVVRSLVNDDLSHLLHEGYVVLDYLTDPKAWFVLTSIRGLVSYERAPFRLDFGAAGKDLTVEATQRYGVGTRNPRGIFASVPAPSTLSSGMPLGRYGHHAIADPPSAIEVTR